MKWKVGARKKITPAKPKGIYFTPKLKKKSGKIVIIPVKNKRIEIKGSEFKKKPDPL